MGEQILTDPFSMEAQFSEGMAEVDSVPKDGSGCDEIEARSPVALIFDGSGRGFRQGGENTAPASALRASPLLRQAFHRIECTLFTLDWISDPALLRRRTIPKRLRQRILFGVSGELTHQDRRRNSSSSS